MDILLLFIGILLHYFTKPLLVIGLIVFFFVARRFYREIKSLGAFHGNEIAKTMTMDRIKADGLRTLGIFLFPVVFLALLILLAGGLGTSAIWIAFIGAGVVSGLCFLRSGRIKKRYGGNFKETFVKAELAKAFQNLNYEPGKALEPDSIRALDFFKSFDRCSGNDLIDARYRGLHFAQCDMSVQERYTVTVRDDDGHTRTEERWRDVFKGRVMRFDSAEPFRGRVQVISKDFDGAAVSGSRGDWQSVDTELADFGKYYDAYATDPLDAMAILTPQMIEGIFYLKQALNVPVALYFTGNAMTVFLTLTRDAFDISGSKTLLEESRLLDRDIALVTGFMDVMYFKRQTAAGDARPSEDVNRAEIAASVAAAVEFPWADKAARGVRRALGAAWGFLPTLIIVFYLVSAVYGFINLPGEMAMGASWEEDGWTVRPDATKMSAVMFLIVFGFFIVIPALGKHVIFSMICLALYLLFLSVNL